MRNGQLSRHENDSAGHRAHGKSVDEDSASVPNQVGETVKERKKEIDDAFSSSSANLCKTETWLSENESHAESVSDRRRRKGNWESENGIKTMKKKDWKRYDAASAMTCLHAPRRVRTSVSNVS